MKPIGTLFSANDATILRDGVEIDATPGMDVMAGDVVRTAEGGDAVVHLADESRLQLSGASEMRMDELVYNPDTSDGSLSLSLIDGAATVLSGLIAKTDPDAMSIHTPYATIGIRGTLAGLSLADDGLQIVNFPESDGFVGEIVVTNGAGVLVLNTALETTSVLDQNTAPAPARELMIDEIERLFGGMVTVETGDDGVPKSNEVEPPSFDVEASFVTDAGGETPDPSVDVFIPVAGAYSPQPEGEDIFALGRSEVLDRDAVAFERTRRDEPADSEDRVEGPVVAPTLEAVVDETEPPVTEPPEEPEDPGDIGDHDRGHGNEPDGYDEDNPGRGNFEHIRGSDEDETFVLGENQTIDARGGHDRVQVSSEVDDLDKALKNIEELILQEDQVMDFTPNMVRQMTDNDDELIIRGGSVNLDPDEWSSIEDVSEGYTVAVSDDVTLHIYDEDVAGTG